MDGASVAMETGRLLGQDRLCVKVSLLARQQQPPSKEASPCAPSKAGWLITARCSPPWHIWIINVHVSAVLDPALWSGPCTSRVCACVCVPTHVQLLGFLSIKSPESLCTLLHPEHSGQRQKGLDEVLRSSLKELSRMGAAVGTAFPSPAGACWPLL